MKSGLVFIGFLAAAFAVAHALQLIGVFGVGASFVGFLAMILGGAVSIACFKKALATPDSDAA